ncbi:MAG: hypothetical protein N4A35_17445 [Flavobacteriales bacterium]|jgi:hypothetical protein|nr:hypothetical protein [Flavobacteriales bacterium]
MKKLLSFIFIQILCSNFGLGQDSDTTHINNRTISSLNTGTTYKLTNSIFKNQSISISFSGLSCGGASTNSEDCFYSTVYYSHNIPRKILINDSLTTQLTGYSFNYMSGYNVFNKNYNIDLAILLGFEFGRLRLYNNPLLRKKNGYFAPKIELQPKFKLKRLVIGGSFGYGYDISNPNWKNTWFSKNKSYTLDKLRQSGVSYQFFIGWSFY